MILPIPLHKKRLRTRGYNQSALVAKRLSKESGIGARFDLLEKKVETRPQVGLSLNERLNNVKGSFVIKDPAFIKGRDILLVDDVMTTGATVNECSKILKKSGALRVDVITIARTSK
jgi:ComF family protein